MIFVKDCYLHYQNEHGFESTCSVAYLHMLYTQYTVREKVKAAAYLYEKLIQELDGFTYPDAKFIDGEWIIVENQQITEAEINRFIKYCRGKHVS
ncbi:hypothetical protein [Klebsiella phage vB_KpnM-VAC36]|nr:hypothetical protein [Klebsiella phage vB_KpnM-VAC36]